MTVVADLQALLGLSAQSYVSGMQSAGAATKQFHGEVENAGNKASAAAPGLNKAAQGASALGKEAEGAGRAAQAAQGGIGGLQSAAAGLQGTLAQMVPQLAAVGGTLAAAFEVKESISAFNDLAGSVRKFQAVTGETAEGASKILFAFKELGVNADTTTTMMARLEKGLQGITDAESVAAPNNKSLAENFHELGIATVDSSGKMLPMSDIILNLADTVHGLGKGSASTTLLMEAFGRGGAALLPAMLAGREGLTELMNEAQKLGHVLSQDEVDAFRANKMAMKEFSAALEGIQIQLGAALMPAVTAIISVLVSLAVRLNQTVVPAIHTVFGTVAEFIDLVNGKDVIFAALGGVIGGVLVPAVVALGVAMAGAALGAMLSPIGLIAGALAALGVAIYEAQGHWDEFKDRFPAVANAMMSVRDAFDGVVNYIQGNWKTAVAAFIEGIATVIEVASNWRDGLAVVIDGISAGMSGLLNVFSQVMDGIVTVVGTAAQEVYELFSYLDPWATHSPSLVSQVQSGADEIIKQFGRTPAALEGMKSAAQDLLGTQEALNEKIAESKDVIQAYKDKLKEATDAYNGFKSAHLAEDKPFDAASKALDQQMAQLRIQIDQLKLAGGLTTTQTVDVLDSKGHTTKDAFGNIKTTSKTTDTAAGKQLKDLEDQLAALGLQADINKQQQSLVTGPMHDVIAAMTDPNATLGFKDIVQGLKDSQTNIDALKPGLKTEEETLKGYESNLKEVTGDLAKYNKAIGEIQQALDKAAKAAASAAAKAGPPAIVGPGSGIDLPGAPKAKKPVTIDPNVEKQGAYGYDSANAEWVDTAHGNKAWKAPTALEEAMASFKKFQTNIDDVKKSMSDFRDSFDGLSVGFGKVSSAIGFIVEQWNKLPDWAKEAAKIVLIATEFGLVGVAVYEAWQHFDELKTAWGELWAYLTKQWEKFHNDVIPAVTNIVKGILLAFAPLLVGISLVIAPLLVLWKEHWDKIANVVTDTAMFFATGFNAGWKVLVDAISIVLAVLRGDWSGAWDGIGTIVHDTVYGFKDFFNAGWKLAKDAIDLALTALITIFTTDWAIIQTVIDKTLTAIKDDVLTPALDLIKSGWETAWNGLRTGWDIFWGGMESVVKSSANHIIDFVNRIIDGVNGIKIPAISIGGHDITPGWDGAHLPYVPRLADGTRNHRGGWALVGERGPELAYMPAGTAVYPADQTSRMQGGGNGVTVHIDKVIATNPQQAETAAGDIAFALMRRGQFRSAS